MWYVAGGLKLGRGHLTYIDGHSLHYRKPLSVSSLHFFESETDVGGLWLRQVMLDELSEAYSALRLGKAPVLPLVRLQYPDFAAWHARRSQSPAILRQVGGPVLDLQYFPKHPTIRLVAREMSCCTSAPAHLF